MKRAIELGDWVISYYPTQRNGNDDFLEDLQPSLRPALCATGVY